MVRLMRNTRLKGTIMGLETRQTRVSHAYIVASSTCTVWWLPGFPTSRHGEVPRKIDPSHIVCNRQKYCL